MKQKGASWLPALACPQPDSGQWREASASIFPTRHPVIFPGGQPRLQPKSLEACATSAGSCQPQCGCTKHNHCNLSSYFCFGGRRGFFFSELWVEVLQDNHPAHSVKQTTLIFLFQLFVDVWNYVSSVSWEGFGSPSELGVWRCNRGCRSSRLKTHKCSSPPPPPLCAHTNTKTH